VWDLGDEWGWFMASYRVFPPDPGGSKPITLVICYIAIEMAIDIVEFPMKNGENLIFHSYGTVYQRVITNESK
jgi:hypothetical protein